MSRLNDEKFTKWVACWGTATSYSDRREANYAKDLTLRYPIKICFNGNKIRFHFSNLTGSEPVTISKAYVAKQTETQTEYKPIAITFSNNISGTIPAGKELCSDEIPVQLSRGETVEVSLYLADFTQMNAGTLVTGPLSSGKYAYGDFAEKKDFPADLSRSTNWYYFLNTIDIFTEEKNHALICYGDSITAQSWPDYLALRTFNENFTNTSIIRRAVCGTRILRQYDCITYQAYGLKGSTRFPLETAAAGATAVIIQHGINDIIHPVGIEVNQFRPWSDMPTLDDLKNGVEKIYVEHAKKQGLKVWSGTLLPIFGWRTYSKERDELRKQFNEWLRASSIFDGCIDFDKTVQNPSKPEAFANGFDSGDHLHPSEAAYKAMANAVPQELLK